MEHIRVGQLQCRLDDLIKFLTPYMSLINCHMVNYLTDDYWNEFVPQSLRAELATPVDVQQAIEILFSNNSTDLQQLPALAQFWEISKRQRLSSSSELLTNVEQLDQLLNAQMQTQLNIKEFMSAKKCHEVRMKRIRKVEQLFRKPCKCINKSTGGANCGLGKQARKKHNSRL